MGNRVEIDVANTKTAIMNVVAAYPELQDDEQLLLDTLEGETNLFEIVSALVRLKGETDVQCTGLTKWVDELSERKARFVRKSDAFKKLIQTLMDAAGVDKMTLDEATVFKTKGRMKVVVKDVQSLPQGFYRIERKAETAEIKKMLENGEEVPGAYLEAGAPSLTIRIK
ncbi:siphovirus Gp157 family protein [uncultured Bartonella sp.]|uniref:siphovirus Gp157 family protein n=1 Tax=uncultured Bartonella sp. TaxID=104108 RepID=UPI0025E8AB58|nr:siphovirus Gp157 family protein [uncultured Bartonella sp.]